MLIKRPDFPLWGPSPGSRSWTIGGKSAQLLQSNKLTMLLVDQTWKWETKGFVAKNLIIFSLLSFDTFYIFRPDSRSLCLPLKEKKLFLFVLQVFRAAALFFLGSIMGLEIVVGQPTRHQVKANCLPKMDKSPSKARYSSFPFPIPYPPPFPAPKTRK